MKKIWNNWLKESIYIFSIIYTLVIDTPSACCGVFDLVIFNFRWCGK